MRRIPHITCVLFVLLGGWSTSNLLGQVAARLSWKSNPESDLAFYFLYRAQGSSGFERIAEIAAPDTTFLDYDIEIGVIYSYRVTAVDTGGNESNFSNEVRVDLSKPRKFELSQNYPNPFNPETFFVYYLSEKAEVTFQIHDVRGRVVKTLVRAEMPAGRHRIRWDGTDAFGRKVATGVYFAKIDFGGVRQTRRLMLIK